MPRFIITLITAMALAVAPTAASAQTPQQIPVPGPILTKLGSTPMVELWDGGGGLPYLGSPSSYNAGDWEDTLRKYHDTGVYEAQIAKVDAWAEKWLSRAGHRGKPRFKFARKRGGHGVKLVRRAHRANHGHGDGQRKKPAIVFDVDETALSNYTAINADNFTFKTNSMNEAQNEVGTAIKPSLELYKLAQQKGIAVFFITGRREDTRAHTAHNLQREGFTDYAELVLKPQDFTGSTVDYKAGARGAIEQKGYRIVANVGDQYSDLAGGHGTVAFKLPNPFYFLP